MTASAALAQDIEGHLVVTEPGVYAMTDEEYHADPVRGGSLSASGAKLLLPPSTPAHFKYWRDHRDEQKPKAHFEFGKAAHRMVLGAGPELVGIDFKDWRTKVAQQAVEEVRERGAVPLKRDDFDKVHAMAAALRQHPTAASLFAPESGLAEQSLFWRDRDTGVMCRVRPDWLPYPIDGRMLLADYKTITSADDDSIDKAIGAFGYFIQAPHYVDGAYALGLAEQIDFVFVFQEKEPPFLVRVIQLTASTMAWGDRENTTARRLFAECTRTGRWPGYADEVRLAALPHWQETQLERRYS